MEVELIINIASVIMLISLSFAANGFYQGSKTNPTITDAIITVISAAIFVISALLVGINSLIQIIERIM